MDSEYIPLIRVVQLEKELLQMRSALERRSSDQATERSPGTVSLLSQEDVSRQVCKLSET